MFTEMPSKPARENGRSVSLGVSMGPFSPSRATQVSNTKLRPLSRLKFARPPRAGTLEDLVEPLTPAQVKSATEMRQRNQPMISHKNLMDKERWLFDVGTIDRERITNKDLKLEMELRNKLSAILPPVVAVVRSDSSRKLDEPSERNMPEHVKKKRKAAARAAEKRAQELAEAWKAGEAERAQRAREKIQEMREFEAQKQVERVKALEAEVQAQRDRASRAVKRRWEEPHNVPMSPTGERIPSNLPSPIAGSFRTGGGGSVVSDYSEFSGGKSAEVQQLELNLDLACKDGNIHQVRMLLAMCPDGVRTVDINGNTPLSIACKYGHRNAVEMLLKEGSDVNHINNHGGTPLSRACVSNFQEIVMLLLGHGADELIKDKNNLSALDYANEHLRTAIKREKERLVRSAVVSEALFDAVEEGNVQKLVSVLLMTQQQDTRLQIDAKMVDTRSTLGWNLLHLACSEGSPSHLEIARLLLQQGFKCDATDADGDTPLHLAAEGRDQIADTFVGLLLECGASETRVNKMGRTPLFSVCIAMGRVSIAEKLLVHESSLHLMDSYGRTCLFYACFRGHEDLATFLVRNGARIDPVDSNGKTPLEYCPSDSMTAALVEARSIRAREEATQSLVQACSSLDMDKVEAILEEKLCDPTVLVGAVKDNLFHTVLAANDLSTSMPPDHIRPLQLAIMRCLVSLCEAKAAAGETVPAQLDVFAYKNKDGLSAFHMACSLPELGVGVEHDSDAVTDYLLDLPPAKGYLEDSTGVDEDSPLHLALSAARTTLVHKLLDLGVDPRKPNASGRVPLHNACKAGQFASVKLLVNQHDCHHDISRRDNDDSTPFELADEPIRAMLHEMMQEKAEAEALEQRKEQEERLRVKVQLEMEALRKKEKESAEKEKMRVEKEMEKARLAKAEAFKRAEVERQLMGVEDAAATVERTRATGERKLMFIEDGGGRVLRERRQTIEDEERKEQEAIARLEAARIERETLIREMEERAERKKKEKEAREKAEASEKGEPEEDEQQLEEGAKLGLKQEEEQAPAVETEGEVSPLSSFTAGSGEGEEPTKEEGGQTSDVASGKALEGDM